MQRSTQTLCVALIVGVLATLARGQSLTSLSPKITTEGAAAERNPVPVNDALLARGQNLYKAKCQRCHGADGAGHGPEADPDHPAGDLTDGRAALRNPDGVMFYKIWNGRAKPKMPAMKTDMTRTDVWTVIHYVKTLRKSS